MIRLGFLLALLALAGCATPSVEQAPPATTAAPPRTIVEATPVDARCRAVGSQASQPSQPAPMTVAPARLGFPVEVTCEAPGYFPTTEVLHERPQPGVLDSAAAGRPVSVMADLSPAAGELPTGPTPFRLFVRLRPRLLETAAEREAFYESLRAERVGRWRMLLAEMETECHRISVAQHARNGAAHGGTNGGANGGTSGGTNGGANGGTNGATQPSLCRAAFSYLRERQEVDLRKLEIDRRRSTFR